MNSRARFCVSIDLAGIRFLLLALVIVSAPRLAFAQSFTITEILAANETAFVDSDGDASDWIEIHNPTTTTTALTGWYLSDDPDFLRKWKFPLWNIPVGAYRVVFASGKNRTNGVELHTNFKLDGDGEFLALIRPDGVTIASQFAPTFPRQRRNISFGLGADGALHYLSPPSPGAANPTNYVQFVADTKFSVDRGFFSAPISVVITTATVNATIYFTTNGSVPSPTNGSLYTAPVPISRTTSLRAVAHKAGFEPSNVDTQTYLFLPDIIDQDSHEGDAWERAASFELLFADGRQNVQENAGLRIQGGFFRLHFVTLKHSFRIVFREHYGVSQLKESLFGPAAAKQFNTLVLRAGANDGYAWDFAGTQPLYIRDSFLRQTITEMGRPSARDFFVHLYLNGVYWGLYDLEFARDHSGVAGSDGARSGGCLGRRAVAAILPFIVGMTSERRRTCRTARTVHP